MNAIDCQAEAEAFDSSSGAEQFFIGDDAEAIHVPIQKADEELDTTHFVIPATHCCAFVGWLVTRGIYW